MQTHAQPEAPEESAHFVGGSVWTRSDGSLVVVHGVSGLNVTYTVLATGLRLTMASQEFISEHTPHVSNLNLHNC